MYVLRGRKRTDYYLYMDAFILTERWTSGHYALIHMYYRDAFIRTCDVMFHAYFGHDAFTDSFLCDNTLPYTWHCMVHTWRWHIFAFLYDVSISILERQGSFTHSCVWWDSITRDTWYSFTFLYYIKMYLHFPSYIKKESSYSFLFLHAYTHVYSEEDTKFVTWHIHSNVFFGRIHSYMWHDVIYVTWCLIYTYIFRYDTCINWFSCGVEVFHTCESDVWQRIIHTCSITQMCNCVSVLYCTHTGTCLYTERECVLSYLHTYMHVDMHM